MRCQPDGHGVNLQFACCTVQLLDNFVGHRVILEVFPYLVNDSLFHYLAEPNDALAQSSTIRAARAFAHNDRVMRKGWIRFQVIKYFQQVHSAKLRTNISAL